ncbi:CrcB protein [Rubricella aquisinus]|uniref:Fluoride-specific ion channel FluC n=1 Tax=Rubricella aquisinus TaxID=2028108 RepID=A0A840X8M7_9RHOB|nr:fluoride efflux transporter CrcB [Rubricella aquisinus]MBB5517077.1 CrcB protein [Rubricella aquisinus]
MTTGLFSATAFMQVALGGAIGAVLRYASVVFAMRLIGTGFPFGTLFVNVVGSFLMGIAAVWVLSRPGMAPFVMAGVLGGFTTFSAFSLDALRLIEAERIGAALLYVSGSVGLCLIAVFAGIMIGRGAMA